MKNICKFCIHRIKLPSGKGSAMYCDAHSSLRTRNHHLRIKCNQPSCERFSPGAARDNTSNPNQLSLF